MKTIDCNNCSQQFNINLSANVIVICPKCKCSVYTECEYGFGPIAPCNIYVGEEKVGRIEGSMSYCLNSGKFNIHTALKKGYTNLEVYEEATDIIIRKLNEEDEKV